MLSHPASQTYDDDGPAANLAARAGTPPRASSSLPPQPAVGARVAVGGAVGARVAFHPVQVASVGMDVGVGVGSGDGAAESSRRRRPRDPQPPVRGAAASARPASHAARGWRPGASAAKSGTPRGESLASATSSDAARRFRSASISSASAPAKTASADRRATRSP